MPSFKRKKTKSAPTSEATQSTFFQDIPDYNAPQKAAPSPSNSDEFSHSSSVAPAPSTDNSAAEKAPLPAELDEWKVTERKLETLNLQQTELKQQLRSQLLSSRTFYNHILKMKQPVGDTNDLASETENIEQINETLRKWFGTDQMSNEVLFDSQRKYFILQSNLDHVADAKRQALANLNYYLDDYQIIPAVVSLNYDLHLFDRWQEYLDDSIVNPEAMLYNLYQSFQIDLNNNGPEEKIAIDGLIEISAQAHVETDEEHHVDQIFEQGQLIMRVVKDENEQPINIYHYHNQVLLRVDFLDKMGFNMMTQVMNPKNPQAVQRAIFYRRDHSLALLQSNVPGEPYIQVFSRTNILTRIFDNRSEFVSWWLDNKLLDDFSTLIIPASSDLAIQLLEQTDFEHDILVAVDNWEQESNQVASLLQKEHKHLVGILVPDEEIQQKVDQLSNCEVNVSVVSAEDDDEEEA
ncbi:hypothetical protein HU830_04195 [Lactobacillus sp. DCY120]|uniref:Uncharacterized protein n=1 Tax=Bombilactobacillus apium TaxID=2675299 RepID=A0A850R0B8_9LACO|nr:hypothetical protein [Bombilactobacillus apium]NVY96373.1 hypothetical protein [Bombilactobacillus apium]